MSVVSRPWQVINGDFIVLLRCVSTAVLTLAPPPSAFSLGHRIRHGIIIDIFSVRVFVHSQFNGYNFFSVIILAAVILEIIVRGADGKSFLVPFNG